MCRIERAASNKKDKSRMKLALALLPLAAIGVVADTKEDKGDPKIAPGPEGYRFAVYCESTDGSPFRHHVFEAADKVKSGGHCEQNNDAESHCTTLEHSKGATVSICGKSDFSIPCGDVKAMAQAVGDKCSTPLKGGERAGGYAYREYITWSGWGRDPAWVEIARNT